MNEIITILRSSGYSITKNINVTPTEETQSSLSVYCIGMMAEFEVKKLSKILNCYPVKIQAFTNNDEIEIKLKK